MKIALEEAIIWPNQTKDVDEGNPLEYFIYTGQGKDKYNKLLDITGLRLKEMNENNIVYQVISPTASGIQNIKLRSIKEQYEKAKYVNNYMYNAIKYNTNRFRAFATLPMRCPKLAAKELHRCITKLGMVGALVNGSDVKYNFPITSTFPDRNVLFYDTKEYDVLWAMFEKLDVPLYLHPESYVAIDKQYPNNSLLEFYKSYPELANSIWGFSFYLAQHVIRLIISGVFDRFPNFKLVLGHLGEFLPWWVERMDHRFCIYKQELNKITKLQFEENQLPTFRIPKRPVSDYFKTNIFITTSGWFSDEAVLYLIKNFGIDRVLFSIDYPYEDQKIASDWLDNLPLPLEQKEMLAYKNAAKLLKLPMPKSLSETI